MIGTAQMEKGKTMRLIDADALVEAVKDYPYGFRGMIVCDVAKQPTIDPIRHGRWKSMEKIYDDKAEYITEWQQAECSVCHKWHTTPYMYFFKYDNFCPNCGARMDEEVTHED